MGRRRESRTLHTTAEVIETLGGPACVSKLTGAAYKGCWGWQHEPTFPSRYYVVMTHELKLKGFRASPSLWGMVTTPEIDRVA